MQGSEGPGSSRVNGQLQASTPEPVEPEASHKGRVVKYAEVTSMLPAAADRFFCRFSMDCFRYKVAHLPAVNPAPALPDRKPDNMKSADFTELKALQKAVGNDKILTRVLKGEHKLYNWLVIQSRKIEEYMSSGRDGKIAWATEMASYLDKICTSQKFSWRSLPLALNYHFLPAPESGKKLTREQKDTLETVERLFEGDQGERDLQTVEGLDFLPPWAEKEIAGATLGEVYHRYWEIRNQLGSHKNKLRLGIQDFLVLFPRFHAWLKVFDSETDYSRLSLTRLEVNILQGWLEECDHYPNEVKGNPVWSWRELARAVPEEGYRISERLKIFIERQEQESILADLRPPVEPREVSVSAPGSTTGHSSESSDLKEPGVLQVLPDKSETAASISGLGVHEWPSYEQYFFSSEENSSASQGASQELLTIHNGKTMQTESVFGRGEPKRLKRKRGSTAQDSESLSDKPQKLKKERKVSPESEEVGSILIGVSETGYRADVSSSSSRSQGSGSSTTSRKRGKRKSRGKQLSSPDKYSSSSDNSRSEKSLKPVLEDQGVIKTRTMLGQRLRQEKPKPGEDDSENYLYYAIEPSELPEIEESMDLDKDPIMQPAARKPPEPLPETTEEGVPVIGNKPLMYGQSEWVDEPIEPEDEESRLPAQPEGVYKFLVEAKHLEAARTIGLDLSGSTEGYLQSLEPRYLEAAKSAGVDLASYLLPGGTTNLDGAQLAKFSEDWLRLITVSLHNLDFSSQQDIEWLYSQLAHIELLLDELDYRIDWIKQDIDRQVQHIAVSKKVPEVLEELLSHHSDVGLAARAQLGRLRIVIKKLPWIIQYESPNVEDRYKEKILSKQSLFREWRKLDSYLHDRSVPLAKALSAPDQWPALDRDAMEQGVSVNSTSVPVQILRVAGKEGHKIVRGLAAGAQSCDLEHSRLAELTLSFLKHLVNRYGDKEKVIPEPHLETKRRFEYSIWCVGQLKRLIQREMASKAVEDESLEQMLASLKSISGALRHYQWSLQTERHTGSAKKLSDIIKLHKHTLEKWFSQRGGRGPEASTDMN